MPVTIPVFTLSCTSEDCILRLRLWWSTIIPLLHWQYHNEGAAASFFTSGGDKTIVGFHDLFNNGQSDTCAFILFFRMQTLENRKYLAQVNLIKTDAIIGYSDAAICSG